MSVEKLTASVTNLQKELQESIDEKNKSETKTAKALHQLNLERNNHKKTNETLCEVKQQKKEVGKRFYEQGHTVNQLRKEIDLLQAQVDAVKNTNEQLRSSVADLKKQLKQTLKEKNVQKTLYDQMVLRKSMQISGIRKELKTVRSTMQDENNLVKQQLKDIDRENKWLEIRNNGWMQTFDDMHKKLKTFDNLQEELQEVRKSKAKLEKRVKIGIALFAFVGYLSYAYSNGDFAQDNL